MVLIFVLILLKIIALFSLYFLQNSWLANKMAYHIWQQYSLEEDANELLQKVERQIRVNLPACIISDTPADIIHQQPLTWWQSIACAGKFNLLDYYYVIEKLGTDSCARVNENIAVNYMRITLLLLSRSNQDKVTLQSTVALPADSIGLCQEEPVHEVMLGRQSWRELI